MKSEGESHPSSDTINRVLFMINTEAQLNSADKAENEFRNKVQTLEHCLHEELTKRSNLEFELYQIKNSLAWKALTKYRSLRDKLLAAGTRRLTCYELVRDFCKVLVLKVKPLILQPQTVSIDCQAFWIMRSERSGFGLIQADATLAIVPDGVTNISRRGSVRTGDT